MRAGMRKYQEAGQPASPPADVAMREENILRYAPLVKNIAERMAMRLPPHISKNELESAGIIGLFDALDKFDASIGIKFQTYAERRIRGAMLDELRRMDWVSRSVRQDMNRIENTIIQLSQRLGREPDDDEITAEMGIEMESYHKMLDRAKGAGLLSLDEIMQDGVSPRSYFCAAEDLSPFEALEIKELKQIVADALAQLPQKEQIVMSLYYYEELTLKEIAHVLELTESRISQIHSKVIIKLRSKLRRHREALQ